MDKIIKLLTSANNDDCIIGYQLLRKKYRYLPLWFINIIILRKHCVHISTVYFPDIYGGSDEIYLNISGATTDSWIKIN